MVSIFEEQQFIIQNDRELERCNLIKLLINYLIKYSSKYYEYNIEQKNIIYEKLKNEYSIVHASLNGYEIELKNILNIYCEYLILKIKYLENKLKIKTEILSNIKISDLIFDNNLEVISNPKSHYENENKL